MKEIKDLKTIKHVFIILAVCVLVLLVFQSVETDSDGFWLKIDDFFLYVFIAVIFILHMAFLIIRDAICEIKTVESTTPHVGRLFVFNDEDGVYSQIEFSESLDTIITSDKIELEVNTSLFNKDGSSWLE